MKVKLPHRVKRKEAVLVERDNRVLLPTILPNKIVPITIQAVGTDYFSAVQRLLKLGPQMTYIEPAEILQS